MEPTFAVLDRFEDSGEILSAIKGAIRDATHETGTVNVLIAGRTGVGKSTLINEVFQGRLAETGQGKPITKETRRLTKKGIPLAIYDTRGLELKEYQQIIDDLVEFVAAKARETDVNQHVHVAWMCVSEDGRRVEEAEVELHRRLAEFMPVLGVITKARADEGFRADVQRLLPEARNVVRVRALSERFDDSDVVLPPMGLEELLEATTEVIPEAVQRAFAAAQKASIELKKKTGAQGGRRGGSVCGGRGRSPHSVRRRRAAGPHPDRHARRHLGHLRPRGLQGIPHHPRRGDGRAGGCCVPGSRRRLQSPEVRPRRGLDRRRSDRGNGRRQPSPRRWARSTSPCCPGCSPHPRAMRRHRKPSRGISRLAWRTAARHRRRDRAHERTASVYDESREAERRRRLSALRPGGGHRAAGDPAAGELGRPDPGRHPARLRGQPPHRRTPPGCRGRRVRPPGDRGDGRGQAPLPAADADAAPPGLALGGGAGGAHRRR